jgi:hypothetical protein
MMVIQLAFYGNHVQKNPLLVPVQTQMNAVYNLRHYLI